MPKNKKIVQVLYSGLGGHASVAFSLLDGFYQKGYQNSFIFYGIEPLNSSYKQILNSNSQVKKFFVIKKETKIGLKEWRQFYKYLKKIKPDFILLHSPQLIIPAFFYKFINKTKIITVEHDAISIRTKSKWIVSNFNAILANHIVVLSNPYKEAVFKNLWFKNSIKKYKIIPNGIDINKYKAKQKYFENEKVVIFMASRMNILRDHNTLIKAVNQLVQNGIEIELRIAGDGNTLPQLKKEYKINQHVVFLGNIDEQQIINELHQTDIYVHATFAETFSTAILQAMSCALPIVTSDIEGTRHMIRTNVNGLLYESKDSIDLTNKLKKMIIDKSLAIKLGKKARKDVENQYAIDKVVNEFAKLF